MIRGAALPTALPAALLAALLVLAGCGDDNDAAEAPAGVAPTPTALTPGAQAACQEALASGNIVEAGATVVAAKASTFGRITQWKNTLGGPDGPQPGLPAPPPGVRTDVQLDRTNRAPTVVCVFRGDPRPISRPTGAPGNTTGTRAIVQGPGAYGLDAIGDPDRLVAQLESLPAAPEG